MVKKYDKDLHVGMFGYDEFHITLKPDKNVVYTKDTRENFVSKQVESEKVKTIRKLLNEIKEEYNTRRIDVILK